MDDNKTAPPAMDDIRGTVDTSTAPPDSPSRHGSRRRNFLGFGLAVIKFFTALPFRLFRLLKLIYRIMTRRPAFSLPVVLLFLGGLVFAGSYWWKITHQLTNREFITKTLITDDTPLAVNMSFKLEIIIFNQKQAIPNSYGILEKGRLVFNTDNDNGIIRVQSPEKRIFYLNDFFTIWEAPFNSRCLFSHCEGQASDLIFYVNGELNEEYENYQLKDGDEIKIVMEAVN